VTIVGAGATSITASQSGNSNYNIAVGVVQTLQVICALITTPTITLDDSDPSAPVLSSSAALGNQWYLNNTAIANATAQIFLPQKSGSYTVRVTVAGCSSGFSESVELIITGVDSPHELQFYPNPVKDVLVITGLKSVSATISVSDLHGKMLLLPLTRQGADYFLDVKGISSGFYLLLIQEGGINMKFRFLKN
jgi:hypothetical protein